MRQTDEAALVTITELLGEDWHNAYQPLVDELLLLRRVAANLMARFEEDPVGRGAKGQVTKSPVLEQYLQVSTRMGSLSAELLLSPRSRKRAGKSAEQEGEDLIEWLHSDGDD